MLLNGTGIFFLSFFIVMLLSSVLPRWFEYYEVLAQIWIWLILNYVLNKFRQSNIHAEITDDAILFRNKTLLFTSVKKIEGEYNHILNVITDKGSVEISLDHYSLVKLTHSILKKWKFTNNKIIIIPGNQDEGLTIEYGPIGKYHFSISFWLEIIIIPLITFMLLGLPGFTIIAVIYIALKVFLYNYKKVIQVSLNHNGITIYKGEVPE